MPDHWPDSGKSQGVANVIEFNKSFGVVMLSMMCFVGGVMLIWKGYESWKAMSIGGLLLLMAISMWTKRRIGKYLAILFTACLAIFVLISVIEYGTPPPVALLVLPICGLIVAYLLLGRGPRNHFDS